MTLRTFFSATLLFCTLHAAQAQWATGLAGGANYTFWTWHFISLNDDLGLEPAPGWRAALTAEHQLSPALSLRVELANQAFRHGLEVEYSGGPYPSNVDLTPTVHGVYNTFGGSLLARISPLPKQRNWYLLTGPTLAYIVDAWYRAPAWTVEGGSGSSARKLEIDLDQQKINRAQWLADFGLGYAFSLGEKNRLLLEGRYQYGLTRLADSEQVDTGFRSTLLQIAYFRVF